MRVLVTGATGYLGSEITRQLLAEGHEVLGLARSDAAAQRLRAAGAEPHEGNLEDLDSLRRAAASVDRVIHTAFFHQLGQMSAGSRLRIVLGGSPARVVNRFGRVSAELERRAIDTLGRGLEGSGRPLVIAFPTMAVATDRLITELDPPERNAPGAARAGTEQTALALAERGVRATVVRLPPVVHGDGKAGLLTGLIEIATKKRASSTVADGSNRWPAVHYRDAARLFTLALHEGEPGARYHAVAEQGVPLIEIAQTIGRHLSIPVVHQSRPEAAKHFGWLASFVGADNPTSSDLTQHRLGWKPSEAQLLADLETGTYFRH